ncbi:MAG: DUF502 domain-containing protein [Alphaproteobacteria bacterium]|nr:DUF502 domain-containing protein [Alphaproteobacteria bacterium]
MNEDADRGSDVAGGSAKEPWFRFRLHARLRTYFLTGIVVTAPISLTIYLIVLFIDFVDSRVIPLFPPRYNPETYLPFSVPGLGILIMVVLLMLVGALSVGLVGRTFMRMGERIVNRTPIVRSIYGALKQVFETVLSDKSKAFREVVLVEFRPGIWAMGFVTNTTTGEIQNRTTDEVVNVFVPTVPNPTTGLLLFVPRTHLIPLEMTPEEGAKMLISGGIVTPPDRRPLAEQQADRIPSVD